MQNEKFWSFVKQMVSKHQSSLKPCIFYTQNKILVEDEYRKFITSTQFYKPSWFECGYQNFISPRNPLDPLDQRDQRDQRDQ